MVFDNDMVRRALINAENTSDAANTLYKNFSGWENGTIVLCGFSPYARKLADTLLATGASPERMLIIDSEVTPPEKCNSIKIASSAVLEHPKDATSRHSDIFSSESTVFIICSNPYSGYYADILHNAGKRRVMTYHLLSVCDKRYDYSLERYNSAIALARTEHLLQNKEFYLNFLDKLADDDSKEIMRKWIMYHLTYDAEYCRARTISPPYFGQEILPSGAYRTFADLGGFDGDTLRDFLSLKIDFDEYWYFEADRDLYKEALKSSDDPRIKYNNLALGRAPGTARFSKTSDLSTTGALSEHGDTEVHMDSIDNISESHNVGFSAIKMDIEGGEAGALYGCERTIKTQHPALMVSVEHKPDDMKTLSEIIDNYYGGYKYYLRFCLDSLFTDLTMYAVE